MSKKLPAEVRRAINKAAHAAALNFEVAERTRLTQLAELDALPSWDEVMAEAFPDAQTAWNEYFASLPTEAFPDALTPEQFAKVLERK